VSESPSDKGSFGNGFFLGLGLCVVQAFVTFGILWATNSFLVIVIAVRYFGLTQLVYMIPLYLFLRKRQSSAAIGLATAACFVAMISISCATTMR
jgi:hypothetical protein